MDELDQIRQLFTALRDGASKGLQLLDQHQDKQGVLTLGPSDAVPMTTLDPNTVAFPIAWGARVSKLFVERIWWTAVTLRINPDFLMACIAFESGQTFSAAVRNKAGSGAVGLIQFMPSTAADLGTDVDTLARMTAEDQINYVYRYMRPWSGKLKTLADCYMAILLPSMVGQPDNKVLFSGGVAYRENSGLDTNHDGRVTKLEAAAKVQIQYDIGRQPVNMGVGK